MDPARLVTMANRIAEFFAGMPGEAEALDGVADHLRQFWEPAMRAELVALADAGRAEGLHPLVEEVLRTRRGRLGVAALR